jgi:hypothetical protein
MLAARVLGVAASPAMRGFLRCAVLLACLAGSLVVRGRAQSSTTPDLATALAGLAVRVEAYYNRIGSIICDETVTQQEVKLDLAPIGKPRVTVYELSVTRDLNGKSEKEFRVERKLQSVNGRRARKNEAPGCTDPKTGTPEPLSFLLPKNQRRFRFSEAKDASGGPQRTRALDFSQTAPERMAVKWEGNCFDADGGGIEGRLWFDPQTFDVLQIQTRLPKPFLIPVPSRVGGASPAVRVERSDMLLRFTRVTFHRPDEEVLLPESIEVVTMFRGVPSLKTVQVLSNFRRFLSESIVRPASM